MKNKKSLPPRSIRRMFPEVTTVIDAKHPILVHVQPKDCKESQPLNSRECAMAKAAKREYKADAVVIAMATSYIIKGNKATRFSTPLAVQKELVSFDRHSDFEPGEYRLIPKTPSSRLGVKRSPTRNHGGHDSKRIIHNSARVRVFNSESK